MTVGERPRWADQAQPRRVLLALLTVTLLRLPLARLMRMLLPSAAADPAWGYLSALAQTLLLFALPGWLMKLCWPPLLLTRREAAGWALLIPCAALAARGALTPLNAWWVRLTEADTTPIPVAGDPAMLLLQVLALAVVPALAEELFFRGALLPRLLASGTRLQAAAVTTLSFALMHGSVAGLPGHLAVSLLLTLLMMRSGRLVVPVAVHLLFNLTALFWPETSAVFGMACGLLLAALLAGLMWRMLRGRAHRLGWAESLLACAALAAMAAQYFL